MACGFKSHLRHHFLFPETTGGPGHIRFGNARCIEKVVQIMENKPEKQMKRTAASSAAAAFSVASDPAPKRYVVNNGFDKLFFFCSILFLTVSLSVVSVLVLIAIFGLPETHIDSAPDFVRQLTGGQYELIEHKPGPINDNFFRCTSSYVLVRTNADVLSNIEHMDALNFRFVPLDSPELDFDKEWGQVYDSTAEIDKVYLELEKTPPGADCRYFVTRDDPDYSRTYLCYSPETKLLLAVRTMRK